MEVVLCFPSRFPVSRGTLDPASLSSISPTGFSPPDQISQNCSAIDSSTLCKVHNPRCTHRGLGSFHFARRYFEIEVSFFSSGYLDVSVPRFPSIRYGLAYGYLRFAQVGFPIRISPDQWIFAPPRSFSQLITSFIGSQCQGIHPALLMLDLYSWSAAIIALMTGFCVLCFKSN